VFGPGQVFGGLDPETVLRTKTREIAGKASIGQRDRTYDSDDTQSHISLLSVSKVTAARDFLSSLSLAMAGISKCQRISN